MANQLFSPDYASARDRFRAACGALQCSQESIPLGQEGPNGGDLSLDVARLGPTGARSLVVVSSGMHGVEGLLGSALQLALLQELAQGRPLPDDTALLLLHALNPFGFAWTRWVNEDNAQLNRNFLPRGMPYQGSPDGYGLLDPLLNPKGPPRRLDPFLLSVALLVARHGMAPLQATALAGQYDHPRGLFYGGSGPSWSLRILAERLPGWLGQAERVLHVDVHSGMGRRAALRILVDHPSGSEAFQRLAARFGSERVQPRLGEDAPYAIQGGLGAWCQERFPSCQYDVLTAEFGTYGPITVLRALRDENRAHHWGQPRDASTQRAKARLREAFVPEDLRWREAVLEQGMELVGGALGSGGTPASGATAP